MRRIRLLTVTEHPDQRCWLASAEFASAGIDLLFLTAAGGADAMVVFDELRRVLDVASIDACLLLGDGPRTRVAWTLADLSSIPVFVLVDSREQLRNLTRRTKPRPDLFFLAAPELLPDALHDDRYGSTLVPTGHPGRDLGPLGPSASDAAARVRAVIHQWARGQIAAATPAVSIIVPAYREAANLPLVCERLIEATERDQVDVEILLVDDGSPDETYNVALAQMWRSPRIRAFTKEPPRGMGNTIRHGVRQARAPILAVTMGDGSDDVARIPEMVRKVRDEGFGLAIGSRYRHRANYEAVPTIYRFWSTIFRHTAWLLTGLRLRDYTNAFRVFSRRIFAGQGLEGGGFEISPEITFKAWFATRRVIEVDVKHLKRASGQSNFSFLRAGPGYAKMLVKAVVCRATGRWFVLDW